MASNPAEEAQRSRTLRRSRLGCRNCKLRKLKCDQGKPRCKRCTSFGVLCNFLSNVPDLLPISAGSGQPLVIRGHRGIRPSLTSALWTSDASACYQLNEKCQDFITRYLGRSLITPRDPQMRQVNRKLLELAFDHPYLMHASLAVAFAYDRYLNGSSGRHRTQDECFHSYRGTVLLNKRLREPIEAKDKDPIWGTAAALVITTFASLDARTPEQAWPLKPSDSCLDWLRISNGKMALWDIVDPLRPDSLFHVFAPIYSQMNSPFPESGINGIPRALAAVCHLHSSSKEGDNPYFHAAHAVSRVLSLSDHEVTTGTTQLFMGAIYGTFEVLLGERDPVALLLFFLWYRAVSPSMWWIALRARVECTSIVLYLRRYHGENSAIQAFLPGGALDNLGSSITSVQGTESYGLPATYIYSH